MTETEANELAKARKNLEYMTKLDEYIAQAERGEIIKFENQHYPKGHANKAA